MASGFIQNEPRKGQSGACGCHHLHGLLARRRLFESVGLFDTELDIANDIEWFARVKDRGTRIVVFDAVVIHKRVHSRNLSCSTAQRPVINREMIRTRRESIHRQRTSTS